VAQRPILLRCVRRHILSRGCPHRVKSSGIGHGNPSVGFSSESRLIAALPRTAARGQVQTNASHKSVGETLRLSSLILKPASTRIAQR
jgi:hypothetical protein